MRARDTSTPTTPEPEAPPSNGTAPLTLRATAPTAPARPALSLNDPATIAGLIVLVALFLLIGGARAFRGARA